MHNFTVAIVDCNYVFCLLQSNHHQAVYPKVQKGNQNNNGDVTS